MRDYKTQALQHYQDLVTRMAEVKDDATDYLVLEAKANLLRMVVTLANLKNEGFFQGHDEANQEFQQLMGYVHYSTLEQSDSSVSELHQVYARALLASYKLRNDEKLKTFIDNADNWKDRKDIRQGQTFTQMSSKLKREIWLKEVMQHQLQVAAVQDIHAYLSDTPNGEDLTQTSVALGAGISYQRSWNQPGTEMQQPSGANRHQGRRRSTVSTSVRDGKGVSNFSTVTFSPVSGAVNAPSDVEQTHSEVKQTNNENFCQFYSGGSALSDNKQAMKDLAAILNKATYPSTNAESISALSEQKAHDESVAINNDELLIWAAQQGHTSVVAELIAERVNINAANSRGITALIAAAANGHDKVVQQLIHAGADTNCEDCLGNTARSWAVYKEHHDIVGLLTPASLQTRNRSDSQESFIKSAHDEVLSDEEDRGCFVGSTSDCAGAYLKKRLINIYGPVLDQFADDWAEEYGKASDAKQNMMTTQGIQFRFDSLMTGVVGKEATMVEFFLRLKDEPVQNALKERLRERIREKVRQPDFYSDSDTTQPSDSDSNQESDGEPQNARSIVEPNVIQPIPNMDIELPVTVTPMNWQRGFRDESSGLRASAQQVLAGMSQVLQSLSPAYPINDIVTSFLQGTTTQVPSNADVNAALEHFTSNRPAERKQFAVKLLAAIQLKKHLRYRNDLFTGRWPRLFQLLLPVLLGVGLVFAGVPPLGIALAVLGSFVLLFSRTTLAERRFGWAFANIHNIPRNVLLLLLPGAALIAVPFLVGPGLAALSPLMLTLSLASIAVGVVMVFAGLFTKCDYFNREAQYSVLMNIVASGFTGCKTARDRNGIFMVLVGETLQRLNAKYEDITQAESAEYSSQAQAYAMKNLGVPVFRSSKSLSIFLVSLLVTTAVVGVTIAALVAPSFIAMVGLSPSVALPILAVLSGLSLLVALRSFQKYQFVHQDFMMSTDQIDKKLATVNKTFLYNGNVIALKQGGNTGQLSESDDKTRLAANKQSGKKIAKTLLSDSTKTSKKIAVLFSVVLSLALASTLPFEVVPLLLASVTPVTVALATCAAVAVLATLVTAKFGAKGALGTGLMVGAELAIIGTGVLLLVASGFVISPPVVTLLVVLGLGMVGQALSFATHKNFDQAIKSALSQDKLWDGINCRENPMNQGHLRAHSMCSTDSLASPLLLKKEHGGRQKEKAVHSPGFK